MNPNRNANLKNFTKGDPRINRRGRPRSFDALRRLAVEIGREIDVDKDMSTVEAILRSWARGNYNEQKSLLEIAYGKVPDKTEMEVSVTIKPPAKTVDED
jgi:hypothetical protein